MKIILNAEEAEWLKLYLNSNQRIKEINFEPSKIHIYDLTQLIVEKLGNLGTRRGYIIKNNKLYFLNDFDPFKSYIYETRRVKR